MKTTFIDGWKCEEYPEGAGYCSRQRVAMNQRTSTIFIVNPLYGLIGTGTICAPVTVSKWLFEALQ